VSKKVARAAERREEAAAASAASASTPELLTSGGAMGYGYAVRRAPCAVRRAAAAAAAERPTPHPAERPTTHIPPVRVANPSHGESATDLARAARGGERARGGRADVTARALPPLGVRAAGGAGVDVPSSRLATVLRPLRGVVLFSRVAIGGPVHAI